MSSNGATAAVATKPTSEFEYRQKTFAHDDVTGMVNALHEDPAEVIQRETGGCHGVLVTAVHPSAFGQAMIERM